MGLGLFYIADVSTDGNLPKVRQVGTVVDNEPEVAMIISAYAKEARPLSSKPLEPFSQPQDSLPGLDSPPSANFQTTYQSQVF